MNLLIARTPKSVKPFGSYEQSKIEIEIHLFPLQLSRFHRRSLHNVRSGGVRGVRKIAVHPILMRIEAFESIFPPLQTPIPAGNRRVYN